MVTNLAQLSSGVLAGLSAGLSLALLRSLVRLAVGLGLLGAAMVLHQAGVPGLLALLNRAAAEVQLYPVFFTSLGIGKLVGFALFGGRR